MPHKCYFSNGNKQKSDGARSSKHGGWGNSSQPHSAAADIAAAEMWWARRVVMQRKNTSQLSSTLAFPMLHVSLLLIKTLSISVSM